MDATTFIACLEDPARLQDIDFQELLDLTAQYPYCQNLRYLVLQKSRQEGDLQQGKYLQTAAVYSVDRSLLFEQLHRDWYALQGEHSGTEPTGGATLELQQLETLQNIEAANFFQARSEPVNLVAQVETAMPPAAATIENQETKEADMRFENLLDQDALVGDTGVDTFVNKFGTVEASTMPSEDTQPAPSLTEEEVLTLLPKGDSVQAAPQPKSTFTSWLSSLTPPRLRLEAASDLQSPDLTEQGPVLPERKEPAVAPQKKPAARAEKNEKAPGGKAKKGTKVKDIAARSLEEDQDVFSETLADLLAMQGHTDKALQMYEKLILTFPEKSGYFARKIEKLKNS